MAELLLHSFTLPLAHPFTISRGTITSKRTLIVELQHGGRRGYGEATENEYYGVTIAGMAQALERVRPQVAAYEGTDPAEFWNSLATMLVAEPFAHCALDEAAHDLWGKLVGHPVYELWGLVAKNLPLSSYTIGLDTLPVMVEKLLERPDWPAYKIKLGTPHDLDIVGELRRHTNAAFRVDANCGWSADETIANSAELAKLGVEFVEQPMPAAMSQADWDAAREVFERSSLPLIADESCIGPADVAHCAGHFHGINIKLMKCGGLTPARRMIAAARKLGLKTMVGCMTESTVGISAIAQLLPLLDYVDMDGALLLSQDIATGVRVECGRALFPDRPGCGAELITNTGSP